MVRLPDPSHLTHLSCMSIWHIAALQEARAQCAAWVSMCLADTLYRVPDIPEIVRENIQQYMETELHIPPSQVNSSLLHNQPQLMLLCCCFSASLQHAAACFPTHHW